jgi:hypothetical protein
MATEKAALDDAAFVSALLDLLVPANGDVPGAGSLGLAGDVAAGLRGDALLGPLVEPGLEAVRNAARSEHADGLAGMTQDARKAFLEGQVAGNPVLALGLLRYLYPAYYAQPQVLAAIGEEPRPPFPLGFEVESTDLALLEKLRARQRAP